MDDELTERITLRLPIPLLSDIKELASATNISVSEFIRSAIRNELDGSYT